MITQEWASESSPAPDGAQNSPSLRVVLGNTNNCKKVRSFLRLVAGDRVPLVFSQLRQPLKRTLRTLPRPRRGLLCVQNFAGLRTEPLLLEVRHEGDASGHANFSLAFRVPLSQRASPAGLPARTPPFCARRAHFSPFRERHLHTRMEQNSSFNVNFTKSPESHVARNR